MAKSMEWTYVRSSTSLPLPVVSPCRRLRRICRSPSRRCRRVFVASSANSEVELFHRVGRGLVLTAAGRALVGPARQMTRSSAAAFDVAIGTADEPRGRLDICSAAHGLEGPIARIVADFRERWPAVTVRVGELPQGATSEQVLADGACEVVFSYWPPDMSGAVHESVGVNEYWLAVPSGVHPDVWPNGVKPAAGEPVSLTALPDLPVWVCSNTRGLGLPSSRLCRPPGPGLDVDGVGAAGRPSARSSLLVWAWHSWSVRWREVGRVRRGDISGGAGDLTELRASSSIRRRSRRWAGCSWRACDVGRCSRCTQTRPVRAGRRGRPRSSAG